MSAKSAGMILLAGLICCGTAMAADVGDLINSVKRGEDPRVRRRAITQLARLGDAAAVPALIAALRSEDSLERRDAARALGGLGYEAAAPALTEALKDEIGFVRLAAIDALTRLGGEAGAKGLAQAFTLIAPPWSADDIRDLRMAVTGLEKIRDKSTLPALRAFGAALLDDENVKGTRVPRLYDGISQEVERVIEVIEISEDDEDADQ